MTLESLLKHSDDSINHCKELLNFLKKKSAMDAEHAKGIVKLCQSTMATLQGTSGSDNPLKSSLWTSFVDIVQLMHDQGSALRSISVNVQNDLANPIQSQIKQMEFDRKTVADEAAKYTKQLQDMYTELKKVKQNHDDALAMDKEAKESIVKAHRSPNVKDKEIERLQQKATAAVDKLKSAEAAFRDQDEACKQAQLLYWNTTIPQLLQKLYDKEQERCTSIHASIRSWCVMEKSKNEYDTINCDKRLDKVDAADLTGDSEDVFAEHMSPGNEVGDDGKANGLPQISVRGLVNPLKAGRMLKKSDETDNVWKPRYFVLMGDRTEPTDSAYQAMSGRLYFFESEDSIKPKGMVDLSGASVYSVDDTISRGEKQNLFLISTTLTTTENNNLVIKKRILYLCAENREEKDDWIQSLKKYALCCMPCVSCALSEPVSLNMDATEQVVANFPRANPKEVSYRKVRSLTLWIMEARDLHVLEPTTRAVNQDGTAVAVHTTDALLNALQIQKSYAIQCFVSVNEARIAKTSVKSGQSPFYGEEFFFDELAECENDLRIEVVNTSRKRNQPLGYLDIQLSTFVDGQQQNHVNKKFEAWLPLVPFMQAEEGVAAEDREGNPAIRVAGLLTQENILPLYEYPSLLNCLFQDDFAVLKTLSRSAEKCTSFARDDFARCLINVLVATESDIVAFRALLSVDVEGTEDPNIIFRGNSMATKAIDQYMKFVGGEFLKDVLSAPIRLVFEKSGKQESCEIDPTRLEQVNEDLIKKHQKRLMVWVQLFWDTIQNSVENCPMHMRETMQSIREMVVGAFSYRPSSTEKETSQIGQLQYSSVSGFIFLRFFCPAILNPKLFGLWPEISDNPVASRTLTLIAKVLQNLANLSDFKGKEPHMEFCNQWILFNLDSMKTCILHFSNTAVSDGMNRNRRPTLAVNNTHKTIDLSRQFNYLYLQLQNNLEELRAIKEEVQLFIDQGNSPNVTQGARFRSEPQALQKLFDEMVVMDKMYLEYLSTHAANRQAIESCPHIQKTFTIMTLAQSALKERATQSIMQAGTTTVTGLKFRKTGTVSIKPKMISTPTMVSSPQPLTQSSSIYSSVPDEAQFDDDMRQQQTDDIHLPVSQLSPISMTTAVNEALERVGDGSTGPPTPIDKSPVATPRTVSANVDSETQKQGSRKSIFGSGASSIAKKIMSGASSIRGGKSQTQIMPTSPEDEIPEMPTKGKSSSKKWLSRDNVKEGTEATPQPPPRQQSSSAMLE